MRAIILAAGRGSRLENLTAEQPKCMVQLNDRPLLDYQIHALKSAGIDNIGVVCGYQKNKVIHKDLHTKFENPIWHQSNMVRSLFAAKPWLEEDVCIISYSDIFYEATAVSSLISSSAPIAITYDANFKNLWSNRFADPLLDLETFQIDAQHHLIEIGNRAKSLDEIQGQYMGLLRLTPEGWQQIIAALTEFNDEDINKLDMTSLLKYLITCDTKILAIPFSGKWGEVDHPSDLLLYEREK